MDKNKRFGTYIWIDETIKLPYYVGKGTEVRAHGKHSNVIFRSNTKVIFFRKNITSSHAKRIEDLLVEKWGRKGIDPGGILENRIRPRDQYPYLGIANRGKNHPSYDKKRSEETKQKLKDVWIIRKKNQLANEPKIDYNKLLLLHNQHKTDKEMAKYFNTTQAHICREKTKFNIISEKQKFRNMAAAMAESVDIDKLLASIKNGYSVRDIAKQLNMPYFVIFYKIRATWNVTGIRELRDQLKIEHPRYGYYNPNSKRRKLTSHYHISKDELLKFINDGLNRRELAKHFDVSERFIQKQIKKFWNCSIRDFHKPSLQDIDIDPDELLMLIQFYDCTVEFLCRYYDVTLHTLKYFMGKHLKNKKIKPIKKLYEKSILEKIPKNFKCIPDDDLLFLIKNGVYIPVIADHFNVVCGVVQKRIKILYGCTYSKLKNKFQDKKLSNLMKIYEKIEIEYDKKNPGKKLTNKLKFQIFTKKNSKKWNFFLQK